MLRLSLHPDGMAPRILNLPEWCARLLHRLRQQAVATNDPALYELHEELRGYPGGNGHAAPISDAVSRVVIPFRYRYNDQELAFFSTTTLFGTPLDVTVAGLALEAFFPAGPATTETLHALAKA